MEQKVLVCGGREFNDWRLLADVLDRAHAANPIVQIIHGGARGADTLAGRWARSEGVPCRVFHADWEHLGKVAGIRRNQLMLDAGKPDIVVAFPGGRGTEDMIARAKRAGVPVATVAARVGA